MNQLNEMDNKLILKNIYINSFFYAAEIFEVRIMSYFARMSRSFVFCGSRMTEEILLTQMDTAPDYKVIGYRRVELNEIFSAKWFPTFLEGYNEPFFSKHHKNSEIIQPFAYYIVYDLKKQLPRVSVLDRFRILYICGECVSTYKALFYSNKYSPGYIARIYNKYSSNYDRLKEEDEKLHNVIINNPYGKPDIVMIGGGDNARNNNDIPVWEEYVPNNEYEIFRRIETEDNFIVWTLKKK